MQFPLLNLFTLGGMDSLQVTGQQQPQPSASGGQGACAGAAVGSKTSSRSASPCRLDRRGTPVPPATAASSSSSGATTTTGGGSAITSDQQQQHHHQTASNPHHHHVKTLSLGSADSTKSDGVAQQQRPASSSTAARHRSPTTSTSISGGRSGIGGGGDNTMDESLLNASAVSVPATDDSLLFLGNTTTGLDGTDADLCYPSSFISNGSSEHKGGCGAGGGDEEADGGNARAAAVLDHLNNKIVRVKDLIRTEQKLRDDNVYEYLKLASNADKQQVQRIKAVFEKKNQKSAQVILQLQKKLNNYQKRVQELEHGVYTQSSHRPPREVLRDMGQGLKNVGGNIRDGITGFSGSVMSKPREFAHLIKNKFGSADNISQMSRPTGTTGSEGSGTNVSGSDGAEAKAAQQSTQQSGQQPQQQQQHHHHHHHHHHGGHGGGGGGHAGGGSATLPASLHAATSHHSVGGQGGAAVVAGGKFPSDEGSECSSVTSESLERYHSSRGPEPLSDKDVYNMFNKQLQAHQLEIERLREKLEASKGVQQEIQFISNSLQDERFKTERLEEQINDLTELHQNEVENLKQTMADMEEKVQYQSEERLRDIHEMLEHCQTKIQKMEHQALQQQQYVMLEGLDNSNARALVVKLINVLLTVLQVVLLLVATCAGIIMPFLRTRVRILTTLTIVFAAVFVLRQWPEVADIGSHVMKRLKDTLDPVK